MVLGSSKTDHNSLWDLVVANNFLWDLVVANNFLWDPHQNQKVRLLLQINQNREEFRVHLVDQDLLLDLVIADNFPSALVVEPNPPLDQVEQDQVVVECLLIHPLDQVDQVVVTNQKNHHLLEEWPEELVIMLRKTLDEQGIEPVQKLEMWEED